MEIQINGKILDFTLDGETTIGQILAGLEDWLSGIGHRISEISIDGEMQTPSDIEKNFCMDVNAVKQVDIKTIILSELAAASLITLLDDIKEYESLDFGEKAKFFETWKESAAAMFISSEKSELFSLCAKTFLHGEISASKLYTITEERLHEVNDPLKEFRNIEYELNAVCENLVSLPLDIQTGKDVQTALTITRFTEITEKIFRVFHNLDSQGYLDRGLLGKNKENIIMQITEFSNVLKELLDAYERNDSVLVGDLAEYEASVRIKELYDTILENSRSEK